MKDLQKIEFFCSQLKNSNNKDISLYPLNLKNLQGISKDAIDVLLEVIKNYQADSNSKDGTYVEAELIKRFLKQNTFLKTSIKMVGGPVSFYQMSHPTLPHIFYMFGDFHTKIRKCKDTYYHIKDWIDLTINNSPVFIDVYIEESYVYKKYIHRNQKEDLEFMTKYTEFKKPDKPEGCYLSDTSKLYQPCFKKSKEMHSCRTSRFHYSDIRKIFETKSQLRGSYLSYNIDIILLWTEKDKSYIDDLNSYLDFIKNQDSFVYKRIRKQFDNIKDKRIKNIIEQSFEECIETLKIDFENYKPSWSITPEFIKKIKNTVIAGKRLEKLLNRGMCLMDHYLMARCFRTFNKIKKEYSRPSYNNIIYTGGAHTLNYIKILEKIGFNIDYEQVNIDMNKMKKIEDIYIKVII
jgi:hypothetical protein